MGMSPASLFASQVFSVPPPLGTKPFHGREWEGMGREESQGVREVLAHWDRHDGAPAMGILQI